MSQNPKESKNIPVKDGVANQIYHHGAPKGHDSESDFVYLNGGAGISLDSTVYLTEAGKDVGGVGQRIDIMSNGTVASTFEHIDLMADDHFAEHATPPRYAKIDPKTAQQAIAALKHAQQSGGISEQEEIALNKLRTDIGKTVLDVSGKHQVENNRNILNDIKNVNDVSNGRK